MVLQMEQAARCAAEARLAAVVAEHTALQARLAAETAANERQALLLVDAQVNIGSGLVAHDDSIAVTKHWAAFMSACCLQWPKMRGMHSRRMLQHSVRSLLRPERGWKLACTWQRSRLLLSVSCRKVRAALPEVLFPVMDRNVRGAFAMCRLSLLSQVAN
jgi:hypothetical protein